METVYDWVTVAIFAGLIVLFLQRSSAEGEPQDSIWQYLAASVGCAVANYLGNNAVKNGAIPGAGVDYLNHGLAILVLIGTGVYVWIVLKPFDRKG
ncbi:XrtV sorting system accessory protein [Sphingomonas sp. MMS24-J13]|uniref:XrtV sorting system accessory protein n=1 Tax=Sphingomonas sp. MMS24-J13 TaxID=3238686 RepID=UPI00384FAFE3